jgi:type III pantothenate kinase
VRLLLDIGNTRLKWAVHNEHGLTAQQAIAHAELNAAALGARVFAPCGQISQLLVSNVAGAAMAEQVQQAARDCWQIEPIFFESNASDTVAGRTLRNAYTEPAKLGVDRWLAMLGAYAQSPAAALVVSVGTAMTLDAFTAEGQHLGGMIVPGPDLMMNSLMRNTSDIATRAQQGQHGDSFFADNTLGCLYQGAVHAATALIEAAYQRMRRDEHEVRLLLTGGAVPQLERHLSMPVQVVPDLVLRGLAALVLDRNA